MPREKLESERAPSIGWLTWVIEHLDSQKIDEEKYQLRMRTRLFNAIVRQMWSDLLQAARLEQLTIEDLGKRLHYHRATVGRWITGESHPDLETVVAGMMFVLRRHFNDVQFASQPDTITRAVRDSLVEIQEEDLESVCKKPISLDALRAVMMFHEHPDADEFLKDGTAKTPAQLQVARNVARQLKTKYQASVNEAGVFDSIVNWAPAFALFMVGLPLGFKVRDEISAANVL